MLEVCLCIKRDGRLRIPVAWKCGRGAVGVVLRVTGLPSVCGRAPGCAGGACVAGCVGSCWGFFVVASRATTCGGGRNAPVGAYTAVISSM